MQQAGDAWSGEHGDCKYAPVATSPFCYLPIDAFDRTSASMQMNFQ
jgi:hypothetical protein